MAEENIDIFYYRVKEQLQYLKSKKLEDERLQKVNFEIIQKSRYRNKKRSKNIDELKNNLLEINKPLMANWRIKRLVRKNERQRKRIEKGYCKGIDRCIKVLDKVFSEYEEE